MDALVGIDQATVSLGLRRLVSMAAIDSRSFERAKGVLKYLAGIHIGEELLRQLVHREGDRAREVSRREELAPDWCASQCQVATPQGEQTTRMYVGADGVLVPTITQQEKDKRRQTVLQARQAMPEEQREALPKLGPVPKGTDQQYKQIYVTRFYNQDKSHTLVGVTDGGTEGLKRQLRRDAARIRLRAAVERVAIIDGAVGRRNCMEPMNRSVIMLDVFHLQ